MGAVNSTFRLPLGALLPAGIFALPARSCLSIHCVGNYRRSKNDHLSWIMLSFLGMCCPVLYIVSTHPFPPWLATCTCGVWQIGFLCWEKGPLGMTGGRQNLTPSFSPMQSRDAFPPLNTVGNHMHRVELEEQLWEQGLWHYSWVSKLMLLELTSNFSTVHLIRRMTKTPFSPHFSHTEYALPSCPQSSLWLDKVHSTGFFTLES